MPAANDAQISCASALKGTRWTFTNPDSPASLNRLTYEAMSCCPMYVLPVAVGAQIRRLLSAKAPFFVTLSQSGNVAVDLVRSFSIRGSFSRQRGAGLPEVFVVRRPDVRILGRNA